MSNVRPFRNSSVHHSDDDQQVVEKPDTQKLQRVLTDLIDATASFQKVPRDREIRLRNFRSDRFTLRDDLIVVLEERGDQYIANSFDTGQYSLGHSPEDAIYNLCSLLEEYYDLLSEDEERLSTSLRAHLSYLRSILQERE